MNGIQPNQYTRCRRCYFCKYDHCHWEKSCPKPIKANSYCPDYWNRKKLTMELGHELEVDADWLNRHNERKEQ